MAKKLEEILKSRGWTDEDLKSQEALLSNPKFRMSIEEEFGAVETSRDKFESDFKAEQEKWTRWHQDEAIPVIDQYAKDRADAVAEAAALRARLTLAEKAGFVAGGGEPGQPAAATASATDPNAGFDPKKHNLPTWDDVNKLANAEGQAIAMAADLNEEYRWLTGGKSLIEYVAPGGQRGMTALRNEAIQARMPMDQYVSKKFDFDGLRKAIDEKRRAEVEAAVRKDERAKVVAEYGQPGTRPMLPSRSPGMFRPRDQQGKQPWEVDNKEELRQRRIAHALETEMKTKVQ